MAISRPFLLALLGVALLGATVFAVQNARTKSDGSTAASQTAQPTQAQQGQPAQSTQSTSTQGPSQVLSAAFSPNALNSASFDAKLTFSMGGKKNTLRTNGAFESAGPKEMPKADVQVSADAQGFKGRAGFVTTGDRAWFTRGNVGYAVPQAAWSKIVKARAKGTPPTAKAPKLDMNPSSWLRNVKSEGNEQMDGVQVTHVSADVSSAAAIADVFKALDTTGRIPSGAEKRVSKVVDDGHIEAWVGNDKILRRATLEMSGKGNGNRRVDVNLDFRLSQVNKPQDIAAPAKVKRGLPNGVFGQFATGLVGGLGSTVGVTPKDLKLGVPQTNAHKKAERAVAQHKKVVIFFENPRALDDQAVADSVRSLDRKTKNVVVLSDDLRNVDNYGKLLENLGVSQAPAIVVIGRSGKAQLVEGYVDGPSLVQVVADAR
jgi:hypothetical protein